MSLYTLGVVIPLAAVLTSSVGAAIFLLLRGFLSGSPSHHEPFQPLELTWRDYRPLGRLLDPADFEFLRRAGFGEPGIRKLRAERRKIYRLCLRSLAHDFNQVHRCVTLLLVQSPIDRPELATELVRQKLGFYRNLFWVEFRVTLHACGMKRMPAIDLLRPLEALQAHLRGLEVASAPA